MHGIEPENPCFILKYKSPLTDALFFLDVPVLQLQFEPLPLPVEVESPAP